RRAKANRRVRKSTEKWDISGVSGQGLGQSAAMGGTATPPPGSIRLEFPLGAEELQSLLQAPEPSPTLPEGAHEDLLFEVPPDGLHLGAHDTVCMTGRGPTLAGGNPFTSWTQLLKGARDGAGPKAHSEGRRTATLRRRRRQKPCREALR